MRRRATLLKLQSYAILLLIISTIFGGAWLFYIAAQLTDQTFSSAAEALTQHTSRIEDSLTNLESANSEVSGLVASFQQQTRQITAGLNRNNEEIRSIQPALQRLSALEGLLQDSSGKQQGQLSQFAILNSIVFNSKDVLERMGVEEIFASACTKTYINPGSGMSYAKYKNCNFTLSMLSAIGTENFLQTDKLADLNVSSVSASDLLSTLTLLIQRTEGLKTDSFSQNFSAIETMTTDLKNSVDRHAEALRTIGIDQIAQSKDSIVGLIDNLNAVKSNHDQGASNWSEFARETTVRVTVVILIIFLVQILVNLFRYGTRLAAFYEARADALRIVLPKNSEDPSEIEVDKYCQLIGVMAPDSLDFGKSPKSPVDSAVEIARQIVSARKSLPSA